MARESCCDDVGARWSRPEHVDVHDVTDDPPRVDVVVRQVRQSAFVVQLGDEKSAHVATEVTRGLRESIVEAADAGEEVDQEDGP